MKKQRYKASTNLNVGTMVQGMIGENKVANLFLENGYIVARPDVDLGIDMVVSKPKKYGRRTSALGKWTSIQVKYNTRISETTYGTSLLVKVTPNECDYIAIPIDKNVTRVESHWDKVIFFPQSVKLKGTEYKREFAFEDSEIMEGNGNYKNQNKRRWAKDFYKLPK
jgi:hypothetical protein|tara:strand:+ start:161 stop:661 length:501 start_codon:yes stop_codon:yes gene_type:complete